MKPVAAAKRARPPRHEQPTLPGLALDPNWASRPDDAPADTAPAAKRARPRRSQIADVARTREPNEPVSRGPITLGTITVPSGKLAIFDVDLMGYLPREALDPLIIGADVPGDRPLTVTATRVGAGRFATSWDHVAIELDAHDPLQLRSRKLGEAPADFGRLACIDRGAIDHWQHEDSLDQRADVIVSGRDELNLAKQLGAARLAGDGHGWTSLPLADAEARIERIAQLKAEQNLRIKFELRPHSHHFDALAAARTSTHGAGTIDVGGARMLLFFTSWGEGVFPVYADLDAADRPVRIRIQLATRAAS